ncbi:MAG: ribbon-helix-helix domain-containing protein [Acidobacteria bacterium]|nr:ribbon-helix-helix domain-containing protein [Acidobacteriota bacterium]
MRLHVHVEDELIERVDALAGRRGRSAFIRKAVRAAVEHQNRWDLIEKAAGSIPDHGHEWDEDPAEWVRRGRREDPRRVG